MVAKKGGGGGNRGGGEDAEEDLARIPLQAIVLADSFTTKFRPITLERPKIEMPEFPGIRHFPCPVFGIEWFSWPLLRASTEGAFLEVLLPLVNIPMIDYTLAWLDSAGIEEVFIFCCAHSKQVTSYLNDSKWFDQPNFSVTTIESHNSVSAGDALRLIYERNVIHGDFVLVSGDTISNMSLTEALQEHKERRKKDANAVMTMVVKQSKPSQVTRQSRLGTDELIMAIDPDTKQLLYYEERADHVRAISLDKALLSDHPSIFLHNDKQDCYIDICSPEVLSLFTDNFDYQHLRRHFVKGLLVDDIMGYKIFTHDIHSSYAARIDNFRSYDSISKDIIQRWTYPLVPDIQFSRNCAAKLERQAMYRASDVGQSRSAQIGPFTVIGHGSTIGNNTVISNSVVGEGCVIGSNVSIEGCYIWHNVTIEDGCRLNHAIVCDGVLMKTGAILDPGSVLSFKVIVGQNFVVPAYSKVSLLPQPIKQDSDEELEYADNNSGILEMPSRNNTPDKLNGELMNDSPEKQCWVASEVGNGGAGFIWSISEGGHEEEWRHSVAPIPADKLLELTQATYDDLDMSTQDGILLARSGELEMGSTIGDSDDDEADDNRDDSLYFEKEVVDTFLRAVHEHVKEDHVILEVNSLRLSYNKTSEDCASALFYGMMKLALDNPHKSASELVKNTEEAIMKWKKLLKYYLPSIDEEIEVILKFEEMCSESAEEFSPLFVQILHLLYDNDVIQEEAILNWAQEKEGADESDRKFVKQSEKLIQWLNEASEEED